MTVRITLISLLMFACTNEPKTVETVFDRQPLNNAECGAEVVQDQYLVQWENGQVSVESSANEEEFVENFLRPQLVAIRHVEYNQRVKFKTVINTEVQPKFSTEVNWGIDQIGARSLHNEGHLGDGVLVAVIDSGVDIYHPQLQGVIYENTAEQLNGLDDDGNGLIDDIHGWDFFEGHGNMDDPHGHGTHVSGIIAASHVVGEVHGVAPNARILPLKFMDDEGYGDLAGAINSIQYAAQQGAKVINASWGGEFCSTLLRDSIDQLSTDGVLFIAAAGNSSKDLDTTARPEYPAAYTVGSQIVVGASTPNNRVVDFSNIGKTYVNLLAPGRLIQSTVPTPRNLPSKIGGYEDAQSGTSMAAPFVAGAAALLWSKYPAAKDFEIKRALLEGVTYSPDPGFPYPVSSQGLLNIPFADILLQE